MKKVKNYKKNINLFECVYKNGIKGINFVDAEIKKKKKTT